MYPFIKLTVYNDTLIGQAEEYVDVTRIERMQRYTQPNSLTVVIPNAKSDRTVLWFESGNCTTVHETPEQIFEMVEKGMKEASSKITEMML